MHIFREGKRLSLMLNLSANINIMHKTTILVSKLILKDFHEITNLQVSSNSINKFFSYTINNSKQLLEKNSLRQGLTG